MWSFRAIATRLSPARASEPGRLARNLLVDWPAYTTVEMLMETLSLEGRPYIALHNLLKLEGWCDSGAAAKHAIAAGMVSVDDRIELRKSCKIIAGQIVRYEGRSIQVAA
jgi:ribosome-associated protein